MNEFYNIIRNEANRTSAEILFYGTIGESEWWDDVSAKGFAKELKSLQTDGVNHLTLRIHSPGGSVSAATAIYNQLKTFKGTVEAIIDGLAASAATIITSAASTVKIPSNALFMIHNPWSIHYGESKDFRKMADTLDKFKSAIVNAYINKTKLSEEEISQMMDDETWLLGAEAVEKGFADELLDPIEEDASNLAFNVAGRKIQIQQDNYHECMQNIMDTYRSKVKSIVNIDNKKGGISNMNYEQLMASLPEDQRAVITAHVASLVPQNTPNEPKVDLSALPQEVQDLINKQNEAINAARTDSIKLKQQMDSIVAERAHAQVVNDIASLNGLAISDEHTETLCALNKLDSKTYSAVIDILKAANNAVDASGALEPKGGSGHPKHAVKDTFKAKLAAAVAEIKKENPKMSDADAELEALRDPELYEEYINGDHFLEDDEA